MCERLRISGFEVIIGALISSHVPRALKTLFWCRALRVSFVLNVTVSFSNFSLLRPNSLDVLCSLDVFFHVDIWIPDFQSLHIVVW